jgi:hypothetical protein
MDYFGSKNAALRPQSHPFPIHSFAISNNCPGPAWNNVDRKAGFMIGKPRIRPEFFQRLPNGFPTGQKLEQLGMEERRILDEVSQT